MCHHHWQNDPDGLKWSIVAAVVLLVVGIGGLVAGLVWGVNGKGPKEPITCVVTQKSYWTYYYSGSCGISEYYLTNLTGSCYYPADIAKQLPPRLLTPPDPLLPSFQHVISSPQLDRKVNSSDLVMTYNQNLCWQKPPTFRSSSPACMEVSTTIARSCNERASTSLDFYSSIKLGSPLAAYYLARHPGPAYAYYGPSDPNMFYLLSLTVIIPGGVALVAGLVFAGVLCHFAHHRLRELKPEYQTLL